MNLESKIIAARPSTQAADGEFTNNVMQTINKRHSKNLTLSRIFRHSPVLVVLAAILVIAAVSGSVYAVVNYLWPQMNVQISDPTLSSSGRQVVEVYSKECSSEIASKKYELKKGASLTIDKIPDALKADCEMKAVDQWVNQTYPMQPQDRMMGDDVNKPGKRFENMMTRAMLPRTVKDVTHSTVVLSKVDEWTPEQTVTILPQTKFVVDRQYGQLSDIKAGMTIIPIVQTAHTLVNNADCNPVHCSADIERSKDDTVAIVQLSYPPEQYFWAGSLVELMKCPRNTADYCHDGNASVDIYRNQNPSPDNAENGIAHIEGTLQSHDSSKLTIQTTSGRTVQVEVPYDLVTDFNTNRSADYEGTRIEAGDTISIMYYSEKENLSKVEAQYVSNINLLIELQSKVDPVKKF